MHVVMHIITNDCQQTADNCKYHTELPDFLTHESASAVNKIDTKMDQICMVN